MPDPLVILVLLLFVVPLFLVFVLAMRESPVRGAENGPKGIPGKEKGFEVLELTRTGTPGDRTYWFRTSHGPVFAVSDAANRMHFFYEVDKSKVKDPERLDVLMAWHYRGDGRCPFAPGGEDVES